MYHAEKRNPLDLIARFTILFLLLTLTSALNTFSQEKDHWSEKMAHTAMSLWKDPQATGTSAFPKWMYDQGVLLKGMEGLWKLTGNDDYLNYIRHSIDVFIGQDGSILTYSQSNYKLDDINDGKLLLTLYRVTRQEKYLKAATLLRNQLRTQPRTSDGGFWHKKIYPHQMWLDGLYMAEPFYAAYARMTNEGDSTYHDIARQFILMEKHSRDPKTGLLYHGWDESKSQKWANPVTGDSPNFWARAIGWYAMALVDALDFFPEKNMYRDSLIHILNRLAVAIKQYQDAGSGCWYQVMDKGNKEGNFLEASASCMFVYALAKGVRKGYLPSNYLKAARKGYQGILKQFIMTDASGQVNLKGTCPVAGLGGKHYRDGTYQYYIDQKPVINDPKGIGAFMLADNEMEMYINKDKRAN